mgnify:CR=1 FL=1
MEEDEKAEKKGGKKREREEKELAGHNNTVKALLDRLANLKHYFKSVHKDFDCIP